MRLTKSDKRDILLLKETLDASPVVGHKLFEWSAGMGMSAGKMQFAFKKMFGVSLHGYCLQRRMQHALTLLEDDRKKLFAVARACGYRHLSSFVTAFKKYHGYTPGSYRRMMEE